MKAQKIIVAHPARQHSYQTAIALRKNGRLLNYITTVYYNNKGIYKILNKVLPHKFVVKMQRKCDTRLDGKVISLDFFFGFIYLFLMNIDKRKKVVSKFHVCLAKKFSTSVCHIIEKSNVDCVIGYDSYSTKLFQNVQCTKILDLTSIPSLRIYNILCDEYEKMKGNSIFEKDIKNKLNYYSYKNCNYFQKECYLADYILVSSSHQKDMLLKDGISKEKICMVKYGMNFDNNNINYKKDINEKVNFLFVGRVEAAKGIYYLLEAFARVYEIRKDWNLNLVGECCVDRYETLKKYPFCNIHGQLNRNEMPEKYQKSDVFIMPSLWEGLSLSLLEAMSFGLPAIATNVTGGEDIIDNYYNGILIKPADIESLFNAILWCLNNKNELKEMGSRAQLSCKEYTWENYADSLNNVINN